MTFPIYPLLLLLLTTTTSTYCPDPDPTTASDISIFHTQSKCFQTTPTPTPPPFATILATASLDPLRLLFLSQPSTKVPVSSTPTNTYILRAKLGTPGQLLFLALDTGSDSAWVPSSSCLSCPSTNATSPTSSSTYHPVNCTSDLCPQFKGLACGKEVSVCAYGMSYGSDSFSATLSTDWLRLGKDILMGYTFGSVNSVVGGSSLPRQGLLGLGRGPNGLLAQSGSLYQGVFSYCLPGYKSYYFSGSLRLGPTGQPKAIRTTPLLSNPHRPSLYYVNLTGVSVGKVKVAVPPGSFEFDPQTGAGTVVDSGTVITRFVALAYAAIRDEFRRQVGSPSYSSLGAFDTCFATSGAGPVTPVVTFHLGGLDLVLPTENNLIHSSSEPLACLAMAAAPNNVNNVVNVIANYQQQNHRVLIDVKNSKVGFAAELCS